MSAATHDPTRLAALRATGLLDSPAEEGFDRLTRLTARMLGVPVALATLVDGDRQFFKSCVGLTGEVADRRETPLSHSFCRTVVDTAAPLVVSDAREHPVLRTNPSITELGVVGYMGVPLRSPDGHVLGALCAITPHPRAWSGEDVETLVDLAEAATAQVSLRLQADALREGMTRHAAVLDAALDCIVTMDEDGRVVDWNPAAERTFGYARDEAIGEDLGALIVPTRMRARHAEAVAALRAGGQSTRLGRRVEQLATRADGTELPVELTICRITVAGRSLFTGFLRDLSERKALRAAELRFQTLVEEAPLVTYVCDLDETGAIRYISPQIERWTGEPASRWTEDPDYWKALVHPDDRDHVTRLATESTRRGEPFEAEYRLLTVDGRTLWVYERETVVRDRDGTPLHGLGVIMDVTPLHDAQEALAASREQLDAVVNAAPIVLYALDADGRFTLSEGSGLADLGLSPGQVVGQLVSDVYAGTPKVLELNRRALAGESFTARIELGDQVYESSYTALASGGVIGVARDVTARARQDEQIAHLAFHDALTGLPNRAAFGRDLEGMLAAADRTRSSTTMLFVDLDQFKMVNDGLGHAGGDELLRQVAGRLRAAVDPGDLLARYGGDEFVLARTDVPPEAAAARVLEQFTEPFVLEGADVEVSASVGIAERAPHGVDLAELVRSADVALHQTKRGGRRGFRLYTPGSDDTRERLTLATRLRRAIVRDELRLHFQPVFDLHTGMAEAVEALVRWEDPRRGLVGPDLFIPHAEETGLIDELGAWVLDAACAQARRWADHGVRPRLTVNVAPGQLRARGFVAAVRAAIAHHRIDPARLVLEVTESTAMAEPERTDPVLRGLRDLGVGLAIDDFGAGHSSLARLRDLPVQLLKIDRAFLRDVPADDRAAAMFTAIITLAGALGLEAVAEGIEGDAQRRFAVSEGCRLGQGFGLARPAPADAITPLLVRPADRSHRAQPVARRPAGAAP